MSRSLFAELKRRNVFKAGVAYLALGWVVTQVTSTLAPPMNLPAWIVPVIVWIGAIGFPFVIAFSWIYEITPEGLKRESEVDRSTSITHVVKRYRVEISGRAGSVLGDGGGRRSGLKSCAHVLGYLLAFAIAVVPQLALASFDTIFSDSFEFSQKFVADIAAAPIKAEAGATFDPGASLTLEAWLYLTDVAPNAWIAGKGVPLQGGGVQIAYALGMTGSGLRPRFLTSTDGVVAAHDLTMRRWTHIAAVVSGGVVQLFVDGTLDGSVSATAAVPAMPNNSFGIGAPVDSSGTSALTGIAGMFTKQVRYWNVARTQEQISADMESYQPSDANGLVADWPLDDGRGFSVRDSTGHGHDATRSMDIGVVHTALLESGPFFVESTYDDPSLTDASDNTLIDFDGDGDLDLVVAQVANATYPATYRPVRAYRNDGHGNWTDATSTVLGDLELAGPRRLFVGDLNGDNRPDLVIACTGTDTAPYPGELSKLLIQSAGGQLIDETAARIPEPVAYTHGLAVADIDHDGDLDMFYTDLTTVPSQLYLNDGTGHFADVSSRLPAAALLPLAASAFCDVNQDGYPDLVLGGSYYAPNGDSSNVPNQLFMNDGTGSFVVDPTRVLPPKLYGKESVVPEIACADLNSDGAPDLLMATDINSQVPGLQLLINDSQGHFTDQTAQLHLSFSSQDAWVIAIHVVDINGDGLPDIVLRVASRLYGPTVYARSILLNTGGANFVDASDAFTANTNSGIAVGDIDGDGRPDLITQASQHRIRTFHAVRKLSTSLVDPP